MLHKFLEKNRAELIERCRVKDAERPATAAATHEAERGLSSFLGKLIETLRTGEAAGQAVGCSCAASGGLGNEGLSRITSAARQHGGDILRQGFPIDHIVHEYGDLGQAVAELATDSSARVSVEEFRTLARCLDQATADAVAEFDRQRHQLVVETDRRAMAERLGFLAHELRNFLNTATLSFAAIRSGSVAVNGATAATLDRSLVGLRDLIERSLEDVRLASGVIPRSLELFAVDQFIADIQVAANLEAGSRGCEFIVAPVEPGLTIRADRQLVASAVANLVQNAFKFTRPRSHVLVKAYGANGRVLIEVEDRCGGLPEGKGEALFELFEQHHPDRTGLGLGLSIARRAVEGSGGTLHARDMPGLGCVFTIDLPRQDPE